MKLLICTQAVDRDDPTLSFFLVWIRELARHFEHVEVICLKGGQHDLPAHVRVHSLGKEFASGPRIVKRVRYLARLIAYVWRLRRDYDAVLVFQNEEYPLVVGWLWNLLRKPVHLWRNHYEGSFVTRIAALFCRKVFYTSRYSYTARFKKAIRMPVGIDLELFKPRSVERRPDSILFLARMAPSKRPEVLVEALERIASRNADFRASFVGDPLPKDEAYYAALISRVKKSAIASRVTFVPGVPNSRTPDIYSSHEFSINISRSGMYDKTIFEAAACGCIVLASSKDFAGEADARCVFEDGDANSLARKLEAMLALSREEREKISNDLRAFAERNSLTAFGERLAEEIDV